MFFSLYIFCQKAVHKEARSRRSNACFNTLIVIAVISKLTWWLKCSNKRYASKLLLLITLPRILVIKSDEAILQFTVCIPFIHCHTCFPSGRLRRQRLKEESKYLTIFNNLWQFCWLHTKKGPSKVGDVITPLGPGFGRPTGCFYLSVASRTSSPTFRWTFWSHSRTNIIGISWFAEMAWCSGFYEFGSCWLCRELSHRGFPAKEHSPACTWDSILSETSETTQGSWL